MIDLLVSLAVISILIAIMLPSVAKVRESARKVICGSNLRQIGMGMSVFADDNYSKLPGSVFMAPQNSSFASYPSPERMDTLRLSRDEFAGRKEKDLWDGIGQLYAQGYVTSPNVFYCPSHSGNFSFEDQHQDWDNPDSDQEIIANYLFRGSGPRGSRVLYNIQPQAALISDSLRSYEDLNHEGGFNVLQAGLAVNWRADDGDQIAQELLLRTSSGDDHSTTVVNAWDRLDRIPDERSDPGSNDNEDDS